MYQKPVLQRFGTFRELTADDQCVDKIYGSSDGHTFLGADIVCAS